MKYYSLFDALNLYLRNKLTQTNTLEDIIDNLKEYNQCATEEQTPIIDFVTEQLLLVQKPKESRRYSNSLLAPCMFYTTVSDTEIA